MYYLQYSCNMDIPIVFTRLGLPKHSAEIFLALEKSGTASISMVARSVRVHRPAVYRALEALMKAGLVSRRLFGRRPFFAAESRSRITVLFSNTEQKIHNLENDTLAQALKNSMGTTRYFEGEKSVAIVFNDVLEHCRRGDTFYRYTSEQDLDEVNRLLPVDYRKRRDTKRLERLVISNPESGKRKRSRLERFIKFLGSEKESFQQNAIHLVYGDRIAFIDLNTFKGFIIENSTLAAFQKTIFKALYRRL